jgi:hypothetical protein
MPNNMTITSQDLTNTTAQMSGFGAQDDITADLPNVIQNMLEEFADRDGVPEGITLSERTAREICDQKDIGSYTLNIASRLTAELSEYPLEAHYKDGLDPDDMEKIVEDANSSYPTVQMSSEYFNFCEGYSTQPDSRGGGRDIHALIMEVNHSEVLLYDPYRFRRGNGSQIKPTRIDKGDFKSAWLGKFEITSTLWVEGTDQKRISQYIS